MTELFGGSVGKVEFSAFGNVDLTAVDGGCADALLAQPKRFALVCYLAIPKPGTMIRRDTLLGVFWPDGDQEHTRMALRQALKFIRATLGKDVILRRGSEEVGLDPALVWCDVDMFEQAVDAERWADAVELYRGELLRGFFISCAPEFEHWLDAKRARLAGRYANALEELANAAAVSGNKRASVEWWERLVRHDPFDSRYVTGLMEALECAGDPANALLFARKHRQLLREELNITLPVEVKAMEQRVRAEHEVESKPRHSDGRGPRVEQVVENPKRGGPDSSDPPTAVVEHAGDAKLPVPETVGPRWRMIVGFAAVLMALVGTGASLTIPRMGGVKLDRNLVVVAPFENLTGDSTLDDLGYMTSDWIRRAVLQVGAVDVVPEAFTRSPSAIGDGVKSGRDVRAMAVRAKAGLAVSGNITRGTDSLLRYQVEIIDVADGSALQCFEEVWPNGMLREAIGMLGQRVAGAVAAEADPYMAMMARSMPLPPTLEAFREHRLAYDLFDNGMYEESFNHHLAAYDLDSTLLRAVVAAGYATRDQHIKDSLARYADHRRHLLSRTGQLDLDILIALLARDWEAALRATSGLVRLEGGYAHVAQAYFAIRANKPQLAVETLAGYDPEPEWRRREADSYWRTLTNALHMLGNHEQELIEARRAVQQYAGRLDILDTEVRALAALGQRERLYELFDEALTYPPHHDFSYWQLLSTGGTELREHGHALDGAAGVFSRCVEWLQVQVPEEGAREGHRFALARSLYSLGSLGEAHELFDRLVNEFPASGDYLQYLGFLGVSAARVGQPTLATQVHTQLGEMTQPYLHGQHTLWQARIRAVLGQQEEAMTSLRAAFRQGVQHGVWLGADIDLQSLRDRADFQELLRPRG